MSSERQRLAIEQIAHKKATVAEEAHVIAEDFERERCLRGLEHCCFERVGLR